MAKLKQVLFCHSTRLDKILTLMNENRFSFSSLNRIFALSLNKISCVSGIKIKFVPLSEDLIINQIVYSAQLALSLDKISCTRKYKIKTSFILIFHSFR